MKSTKRAYRRHTKKVKFEKRLNNWLSRWGDNAELIEEREKARSGESWLFLRTTGKSCSCRICSFRKYKRPSKSDISREIDNQLNDF